MTEPEFVVDEEPTGRGVSLREAIAEAIRATAELRKALSQRNLRYEQELFLTAQLIRDLVQAKESRCDELLARLRVQLETEQLAPEARAEVEQWAKRVEAIQQALDAALERHEVQRFVPSGATEPQRDNVVGAAQDTGLAPGTIVQVMRAGYRWRGELLQPADVVVAE